MPIPPMPLVYQVTIILLEIRGSVRYYDFLRRLVKRNTRFILHNHLPREINIVINPQRSFKDHIAALARMLW